VISIAGCGQAWILPLCSQRLGNGVRSDNERGVASTANQITMNDLIAGIVTVEHAGQKLTSDEAAALELKFNALLLDICGSPNIEAASSHLDLLGQLQHELARAWFKWNVELPLRLRRLVREFDRSDDPDLRLAVYKQIKGGAFLM
jgi:hypothetical protein